MSRFLSSKYASLEPYTPGEQPKTRVLTKLNTNESPYPPAQEVIDAAAEAARMLQLYPDPDCTELRKAIAAVMEVDPDEVLCNNGSDEGLYFAYLAYCDGDTPAVFPQISYGFYPVFADITGINYREIPLRDDFSIAPEDYYDAEGTVFIANPNAPTGVPLSRAQIEDILQHNPENVVVIDEAYVDFGTESAVPLVRKYDNLLVVQTFSKSRSLAGMRLGFVIGCKELIADLNALRFSTNPYNIDRIAMAAGIATLKHDEINKAHNRTVMETREYTVAKLKEMGFVMTNSTANFIFVRHPEVSGEVIFRKLRERGVIVRHFTKPQIAEYNRITIGSREQMDILLRELAEIMEEEQGSEA
ncbi:MAG: histidinol-phosphate transaminase [Mogibacterium sp.]|nr:histidinol-phosphate transaminase [Mogibacterium sp.]